MSGQELYDILSTIKVDDTHFINVAHDHFTKKVEPPFILYKGTDDNSFYAEDKTYYLNNKYIIDLAVKISDGVLAKKVEDVLDENYIPYQKTEDYLEQEQIYQIRYFI